MMYQINDVIVYPAQGLTEVQAIESRTIGGNTVDFYVLKILKKNISVMVPVSNRERIGLRPVASSDEVGQVGEILGQETDSEYTQWHHRYSENFEKLKTGSLFRTAEVLRDLAALKSRKSLAIKETRMMENARAMLISEIAHVLALAEQTVGRWVDELLTGGSPSPLPIDEAALDLEQSA